MATKQWGPEVAERYDATSTSMFEPELLDSTVDVLAEMADGGAALEFAIGTGRVALPLSERGVSVSGLDLSASMIEKLVAKPGADKISVAIGDMTSTRVDGTFGLVYLVYNTIMNVTSQDGQVAVFENATAHLGPGGRFVVEVIVPQPQRLHDGDLARVFSLERAHVGVETYDDPVGQISSSHHWFDIDGRLVHNSARFRYVWPSELDLMARIAGMSLEHRWSDWQQSEFDGQSLSHVSVWRLAS